MFNYLHPHRIRPFQWSCVVSLWILRFSIDLYMYINLVDGRGRWYGATHRYHTALHTLCLLLPVAVTATIAGFFPTMLFFLLFSSIISVIYLLYISLGFDHFTRSKHFFCWLIPMKIPLKWISVFHIHLCHIHRAKISITSLVSSLMHIHFKWNDAERQIREWNRKL